MPLLLAADAGHVGIAKLLVEAHADRNAASKHDGLTVLMKAARRGHTHVAKMLLEAGNLHYNATRKRGCGEGRGDGGLCDLGGETALMLAVDGEHAGTVEVLLGHGADISIKAGDGALDAIRIALRRENWALATMLVEAGGAELHGALMWGIKERKQPIVRFLADHGADVNRAGAQGPGNTPVAVAAASGSKEIVSLLVAKGAELQGPFVWAAGAGHREAIKLLHAEGAELDVPCQNEGGDVALLAAAREGHVDVLEYLVSEGADVEGCNKEGQTPLMAAAWAGRTDAAAWLIKHGADVNAQDRTYWGSTVLMHAAFWGQLEVVALLLRSGVHVKGKNKHNNTALDSCRYNKHKDVENMLVRAGAE